MARQYSSISVETTLASGISSTATTMTVAAGTGSALLGGVTLAAGNVDQFTVAFVNTAWFAVNPDAVTAVEFILVALTVDGAIVCDAIAATVCADDE